MTIERDSFEVSHPHMSEFMAFLPELNKESERGMVMIAMSFIDELLGRTILSFLIDGKAADALFEGFNAPLGTLSARIAAATALGLIYENEAREIDRLRKIRNRFAHEVHMSFEDQAVRDMSGSLEMAARDDMNFPFSPRGCFMTSAVAVIISLTNRPHYVGLEKLRSRIWKR